MSEKKINFNKMVDKTPINMLFSTPDGIMTYMNDASFKTLKKLESLLPEKVENLLNHSIDWFHKNPEVQRKIISDPKNLPYQAYIKLGDEELDLYVSAVIDDDGDYLGAQVNWSIVTETNRLKAEMTRSNQMIEKAPINIMMATPEGLLIYMNETTKNSLKKIEHALPAKVDKLIGNSIDWFHKNPEIQKKIISDPKNLPHRAQISVGGEILDFYATPVFDNKDNYQGPMVTWEYITEKVVLEDEMIRIKNLVEKSPINTMMADLDGNLTYLNKASLETLKSIEKSLPVKLEEIEGINLDRLHKNPSYARSIFNDPNKLPHQAVISLGEEQLSLKVAAVENDDGEFLGPMLTWEVVTQEVDLINNLSASSEELNSAAMELLQTSNSLSSGAEETSAQANTASTASEEVNAGVQAMTTNMNEMTSAIKEITKTTTDSYKMSANAKEKAHSSIAQQTNLLALNATIEAARAGDAGKGFAVVANEVKELAKQTARATNDITQKIENIQGDSVSAVQAIQDITDAIDKVNQYASNIAASVEEQAATTNEVTRIVSESAEGVNQITENITQVSIAAENTGKDAMTTQQSAKVLGVMADKIKGYIQKIKIS